MKKKPNIPNKMAAEKALSDLKRLVEGKDFKSQEEMNEYIKNITDSGEIPVAPAKNALQLAQDMVYEAWEAGTKKECLKLAKEALKLSPDCADAYNILAEEEPHLEKAMKKYMKGMEAGRRALGEGFFKENKGHFWGMMESRPYMRSKAGYMECLWASIEYDDAIKQAREMLKLNPGDNQGIRYLLSSYLAELGRYGELDKLLNYGQYRNDGRSEWLYTQALLSFVREGASEKANRELKAAFKRNKYVPGYLTGKKKLPGYLPDRITMGGEDEGFSYAKRYLKAWKRVSGSVDWLKEQAGIKIIPKADRNEPCPCGSGKKYKKCCGK